MTTLQSTSAPDGEVILWLDLEDTIITPVVEGWNRFEIINLEKIQEMIRLIKPNQINIFSFAIWDEHQRRMFDTHCRPHLEAALDCQFNMVPTVDNHVIPAACQVLGLSPSRVEFSDASSFWSKQESFRLFLRRTFANRESHHVLLDDAVENEEFEFPHLKISGAILNIDRM